MAAVPKSPDIDRAETEEWLESLEAVIERDGVERAHYLLEELIDHARRSGANLAYSANTAYLNTIPESREEHTPGDPAIDRFPNQKPRCPVASPRPSCAKQTQDSLASGALARRR